MANGSDKKQNDAWHYAINSDKRGPVSKETLKELLTTGELNESTYVWRSGLSDWMHINEVEDLQDLLGGGEAAYGRQEELSSDTVVESADLIAQAMAELEADRQDASEHAPRAYDAQDSFVAEEATVVGDISSENMQELLAAAQNIFDDVGGDGAEEDEDAGGIHARRQSSVLFELDALGRSSDEKGKGDDFATETSGLLDIQAMASAVKSSKDSPFSSSEKGGLGLDFAPGPQVAKPTLAMPMVGRRKKPVWPFILGAVVILLLAGGAWWVMQNQAETERIALDSQKAVALAKEEARIKEAELEKERLARELEDKIRKEAEAKAQAEAEARAKIEAEARAQKEAEEKAAAEAAKEEAAQASAAAGSKRPATAPTKRPTTASTSTASQKTAPRAPAPSGGGGDVNQLIGNLTPGGAPQAAAGGQAGSNANLPKKLSAVSIRNAIRGRFAVCSNMVKDQEGSVRVQTQFTIGSSGVVQSVRITDAGGTSPQVQNCISGAIKQTKFEAFQDPTMQVNFPIRLK